MRAARPRRGLNIATNLVRRATTRRILTRAKGASDQQKLRSNGIDSPHANGGGLGNNVMIPLDALSGVDIQTALPTAARGRNGGGNIELNVRSGSDRFSGSASAYLQHERLNANEFFLNRASVAKPEFRRNDATMTLGGPIVPRRTFFFAAGQRQMFRSGYASNANAATGLPTGLTDVRTAETIAVVANEWLRTGQQDDSRFAANFMTALRSFPAEQQAGLIAKFFADPAALTFRTLTPADIHPVAINTLNQKRNDQFLIPSPSSSLQTLRGKGLAVNTAAAGDSNELKGFR